MPSTAQSTRTVGVSMPLSQSIASVTCGTHCLTIRGNQMQSDAIRGNQSIASVTCGTHGLALGRTTVALSVALGRTVMWDSGTQSRHSVALSHNHRVITAGVNALSI